MITITAIAIVTLVILTFGYIIIGTIDEYNDIVDRQEGRK